MFTLKYQERPSNGVGAEHVIGDVVSVTRTHAEPESLEFDLPKGLTVKFKDGSMTHYSSGNFWLMNERGATVASYIFDN